MATGDPDDIDALLAQVDASLNPGKAAPPPSKAVAKKSRGEVEPAGERGGLGARLGKAALSGGVAAVVVGVLFFFLQFLPFVGPITGALGAFVGGFLVDLARGR